ncbi:MAG: amino acid permease [Candidatus Melainabacteria bacterium]|nr:amino acid permease [Candidatus Melainabacteria bacterium]
MLNNKNPVKLFALVSIIFFSVSGGPYGLEEIVSSVGPINTLLLIVILPIIWTIPETMIIAELSSTYPVQGGYYRWVQMGLGRFWGFMEGWWSVLYTLVDLSLYPILFTTYLKLLIPGLDFFTVYLIQLIVIWSCAFINILGIRVVGNFLSLFQIFILVSFALFVILGMRHISLDFTPILKSSESYTADNLLLGLSIAFWNFIGWDNGSTVLHEIDNPEVNYHKALFISIPIIVIFYFFPILVGLSIHTDWHNWKFGEFSFIANSMNQPLLAVFLSIGGIITALGLFNSMLLSSTRVILTMAEDKLLPGKFALIHKKFHTPYIAIIFTALVYSFLVLFGFKNLIVYDVLLYLIAILLEAIALIALRKMHPAIKTNFRIPFGKVGMYFVVTVVSLIVFLVMLINVFTLKVTLLSSFFNIFLILSGIPVYLWYEKLLNTNPNKSLNDK